MENKLIKKFLSLGFYPGDLPPEFRVSGVSLKGIKAIVRNLNTYDPVTGNSAKRRKPSVPTILSGPKTQHSRRWFHVINPLHFVRLSVTIGENWNTIEGFCDTSKFSTSRIGLSSKQDEIFSKSPFRDSVVERIKRSAGKKYQLKLDISKFYPSIYTHSLEWILEGRRLTPQERRNRSFIGVALDQDCRISQDGKTNGIVVGPITSRVISEIVAVHIDEILTNQGVPLDGIRYVDDYSLYFESMTDLERIKTAFQAGLNKIHLSINEAKTQVKETPEVFEEEWVRIIRRFELSDKSISQQNDLVSLFSLGIQFAKKAPNDYCLKYLLTTLTNSDTKLSIASKNILSWLCVQAIQQDPRTLSAAFKLIEKKLKAALFYRRVTKLLSPKLLEAAELGLTYECLWIMHGFLKAKEVLPAKVVQYFIQQDDILCLTYSLRLSEENLLRKNDKSAIVSHIETAVKGDPKPYNSIFWLPLYENEVRGWWKSTVPIHPFFELLKNQKIDFLMKHKSTWKDIGVSTYPRTEESKGK